MYMQNPAITVVIPVYNVESFLKKSLRSLENQTFKNFEVIIIDDGSTDESLNIIKEFCTKNKSFKYIKQENKGPGPARNTGIKASKGDYISFVDGDDFVEPDFLEKLYFSAVTNNSDIVCCNYSMYYPNQNFKFSTPFFLSKELYTSKEALKKLISDSTMRYFCCNKLFKKTLFTQKKFSFDKMYYEDIAALPKIFYRANKISIVKKPLYNYTIRKTSITNNVTAEKVNDYIKSIGAIRNFLENKKIYKNYKNRLWLYAQRSKLVVYYYMWCMHVSSKSFKGFFKNTFIALKSINYFLSKKFSPVKQTIPPVPNPVYPPEKITDLK